MTTLAKNRFWQYIGTNGSMGLITANKYHAHAEIMDEKVYTIVYLVTEPAMVHAQDYAKLPAAEEPYMPFITKTYDNLVQFRQDWIEAGDCVCTQPGQDDGQTTCWPHHDCSRGDCSHGE